MTDKTLDFRTTRKSIPVPCFENTYKANRPVRSAKKSLPIDEVDPMNVYQINKAANKSPDKKDIMQSENMRPKRTLDSSGYLTKKFLYQEEPFEKKVSKKRVVPDMGRNFKKPRPHQDGMYIQEHDQPDEDLEPEDWANNSSEGENIFESPKFARYPDGNKVLNQSANDRIYRILNPEFQHGTNQTSEEETSASPTKMAKQFVNEEGQVYEETFIDEAKMNFVDSTTGIYYNANHRPIMIEQAKEKLRFYDKSHIDEDIDQSTMKTPLKMKNEFEAEIDEQAIQDTNMNFYRKRNSSESSKTITTYSSPMHHQVDGFMNKNAFNNSYSSANSNQASTNNNHMFVACSNSRKRPTILKRNNAAGNSASGASNSNSSNSTSVNSNPKVPPPMSRYPPPKFLTRQLVQMAAAAQRNPNNAAAVFSARKVLSSVPPQLAASVVNSVLAASQTTNSTPQVIQLATAVATSQQAALVSNSMSKSSNSMISSNNSYSNEDPMSPNYMHGSSNYSTTKHSPTSVNSSQFSQPMAKQQVTASDKLFGRKITGKYLPPSSNNNMSYPSPVMSSQQSYAAKMNHTDHNQQDQPAVRVNVGGRKVLVVGGAVKKLLSNMQNSPNQMNRNNQLGLILQNQSHQILMHDQDKIIDEETAKTFDEIQGYIPHCNEVDNMKDYETLEQNIVLDGQHIDMNEH